MSNAGLDQDHQEVEDQHDNLVRDDENDEASESEEDVSEMPPPPPIPLASPTAKKRTRKTVTWQRPSLKDLGRDDDEEEEEPPKKRRAGADSKQQISQIAESPDNVRNKSSSNVSPDPRSSFVQSAAPESLMEDSRRTLLVQASYLDGRASVVSTSSVGRASSSSVASEEEESGRPRRRAAAAAQGALKEPKLGKFKTFS